MDLSVFATKLNQKYVLSGQIVRFWGILCLIILYVSVYFHPI